MKTGVLVLGHGSRDAAANTDFEALVAAYSAAHPELDVAHGYVELAEPPLAVALQTLARRCEHVVVLPLFLFAAGHVKNDLPLALHHARRDWPKSASPRRARLACTRPGRARARTLAAATRRRRRPARPP